MQEGREMRLWGRIGKVFFAAPPGKSMNPACTRQNTDHDGHEADHKYKDHFSSHLFTLRKKKSWYSYELIYSVHLCIVKSDDGQVTGIQNGSGRASDYPSIIKTELI